MSRGGGRGGARGGKAAAPRGGASTFTLEQVSITKADLPPPTLQPPPAFPPLTSKCLPLKDDDEEQYLLHIKDSFIRDMRESRFFLNEDEVNRGIERYSDKYTKPRTVSGEDFDRRLFPEELLTGKVKRVKSTPLNIPTASSSPEKSGSPEKQQQKDGDDEEGAEKEGEEADDNEADPFHFDDEDVEDDNDYMDTYFDPGEDYVPEADVDDTDGPVY